MPHVSMFGNQWPTNWPESRTAMVCKSLDVFSAAWEGDGFMEDRRSLIDHPGSRTGIRQLNAYILSDRRRIVAQVRRKVPKYRGFFSPQNFWPRCDALLTSRVDRS